MGAHNALVNLVIHLITASVPATTTRFAATRHQEGVRFQKAAVWLFVHEHGGNLRILLQGAEKYFAIFVNSKLGTGIVNGGGGSDLYHQYTFVRETLHKRVHKVTVTVQEFRNHRFVLRIESVHNQHVKFGRMRFRWFSTKSVNEPLARVGDF